MSDQNNLLVLRECLVQWEQQNIGSINWARSYPPDTTVRYADVPDIMEDGVTTPRWEFETSVGRVSFVLRNGTLEPQDIFETSKGHPINHHSHTLDIGNDLQGFRIFGQPERRHFQTDIGYAWASLRDISSYTRDAGKILNAWVAAATAYHAEVGELKDSVFRRRQILAEMGAHSAKSEFSTQPLTALYDITDTLLTGSLLATSTDPSAWTGLRKVPLAQRQSVVLSLYAVPGTAMLLDSLAHYWKLHGWTTLSSIYDTSDWARVCLRDDDTSRALVSSAIGCERTECLDLPPLEGGPRTP